MYDVISDIIETDGNKWKLTERNYESFNDIIITCVETHGSSQNSMEIKHNNDIINDVITCEKETDRNR